MNSIFLKLFIISCLILQAGCSLKFKRKSPEAPEEKKLEVIEYQNKLGSKGSIKEAAPEKQAANDLLFSEKDSLIIKTYYADEANVVVRHDMQMHTKISRKQEENLQANKFIPRDIQVMPLPLQLERKLSAISLNLIRVQVANYVVLMNVKSRQILDIIKI